MRCVYKKDVYTNLCNSNFYIYMWYIVKPWWNIHKPTVFKTSPHGEFHPPSKKCKKTIFQTTRFWSHHRVALHTPLLKRLTISTSHSRPEKHGVGSRGYILTHIRHARSCWCCMLPHVCCMLLSHVSSCSVVAERLPFVQLPAVAPCVLHVVEPCVQLRSVVAERLPFVQLPAVAPCVLHVVEPCVQLPAVAPCVLHVVDAAAKLPCVPLPAVVASQLPCFQLPAAWAMAFAAVVVEVPAPTFWYILVVPKPLASLLSANADSMPFVFHVAFLVFLLPPEALTFP